MVSYDTEEQQIEKLKSWWQENGASLLIGAGLGLAVFFGWKYWDESTDYKQELASDLYNRVIEVVNDEDKTELNKRAQAVKDQHPDSSYAIFSAFHLAKSAVDDNQFDKAAEELNWVIKSASDAELEAIAKIRLARILIAQNKADDALKLLEMEKESGYYAMANLVKGDALLALERKHDALKAYKDASSDQSLVSRHPSLQFLIDSLSDAAKPSESTSDEVTTDKVTSGEVTTGEVTTDKATTKEKTATVEGETKDTESAKVSETVTSQVKDA